MKKEPPIKLIQVNRTMSNARQYATHANKQKNEENEDTDSNFSVNILPTTDSLTLLTKAMSSLIASIEDDRRSRKQAESERKQEERERREFEAKAEAERKQEEREEQEFEDAHLRHWEQIEQDRQAHLEFLEGANAEREAAAIEARNKASQMCKAQNQTDLAFQKKQAILQALPKLDDHTNPEAFLATFEEAMEEGDFQTEEWTKNIRKLLTGKASLIYHG